MDSKSFCSSQIIHPTVSFQNITYVYIYWERDMYHGHNSNLLIEIFKNKNCQ